MRVKGLFPCKNQDIEGLTTSQAKVLCDCHTSVVSIPQWLSCPQSRPGVFNVTALFALPRYKGAVDEGERGTMDTGEAEKESFAARLAQPLPPYGIAEASVRKPPHRHQGSGLG